MGDWGGVRFGVETLIIGVEAMLQFAPTAAHPSFNESSLEEKSVAPATVVGRCVSDALA